MFTCQGVRVRNAAYGISLPKLLCFHHELVSQLDVWHPP